MKFITTSTLLVAGLASQVNAWWGQGHTLVARIAQDLLEESHPEVVTNVEKVLAVLAKSDPGWTEKERDHPMVECATFADDIKGKGGRWQSPWHFIDRPYLDQGGTIHDYPEFVPDTHNITEAISAIVAWFKHAPGYKDSYEYQQIRQHEYHTTAEADGLSTAMRLLIHYAGDVHQPLHASTRINKDYPKGDRGGNDFPLPSEHTTNELHQVWDSVLFEYEGYQDLPFSASGWSDIVSRASGLMKKWPVSDSVANDLDPTHWAADSYKITTEFVYTQVKENATVPQSYVDKGREYAERQIVTGGHRLANLLISLPLADRVKDIPEPSHELVDPLFLH